MVWCERRYAPQPWTSANPGRSTQYWNITHHPTHRPSEWTGRKFRLGKSKEVFDAEVSALLQALKISLQRNETGRPYTIFSDSGNEMADLYAKAAVENTVDAVSRQLLRGASLAFISGSITETKRKIRPGRSRTTSRAPIPPPPGASECERS